MEAEECVPPRCRGSSLMYRLRPYRAQLGLLCAVLTLGNLIGPIIARAQPVPPLYVWQIERVESSSAAWVTNTFVAGDVAFTWQDIPAQMFPLEVWEVSAFWAVPAASPQHLAARVLLYDGSHGALRYVYEHVVLMPGLNRIRLRVDCSSCRALFGVADGPRIGVGIQYVTEYEHPITVQSGHLVFDNDGCWPGHNLVFDAATQQWLNPCTFGQLGNFTIRAVFEPLCPARLGDADGDQDIDTRDFLALQAAVSDPGPDVFGDSSRRGVDLNNDWAITYSDLDIWTGHLTGPDSGVVCPRASNDGRTAPMGALRAFSPGAFPHLVQALQVAPRPTDKTNPTVERWSYTNVGIGLSLLAILSVLVGPCVQSTCRDARRAIFAGGSRLVTEEEETRIRAAIDLIGALAITYGNDDAERCHLFLSQAYYYNPRTFGSIKINRNATEDEVEFAATKAFGHFTLHPSFVTGNRWDQHDAPGLALLLFAEWQHLDRPELSERACQNWLVQWREAVGLGAVAPEFGHGFGD